ncbi:MAG: 3-ketosteroid-delta-1-dehydrogenase [Firmicutes bacterium ADurb.Bin182]|nr:MAG: 3-ketosteroid-delta-1-dehydrogenase [Firmicutes bacterium ADurb.Bin182]
MKQYDVIVAGGGTAGVSAAIAAARRGSNTLVIEQYGHLGGTAVGGIPFLGALDGSGRVVNRGIFLEIVDRLKKENACFGYAQGSRWNTEDDYQFSLVPFDPEIYKYVAQEMVLESGADILLHTYVTDVKVENGRIQSVEVANKSGKQLINAKTFVDCTGDADLVAMAGGKFIENSSRQNCSILFRAGNVDLDMLEEDLKNGRSIAGWGEWHTRVTRGQKIGTEKPGLIHLAGHMVFGPDEPEITFTAVSVREGEVSLNATRVPGLCAFDGNDVTKAEILERKNVMRIFKMMRERIPSFKNAVLIGTSPIGFRESRNILGDYILTKDDVLKGARFSDGVAQGAYPIDIHDPNGGRTKFMFIKDGGSYEIPYRCLIPVDLKNVLVAGKTISATHEANGSSRIMACVISQGEAAGTAASVCIKNEADTRSVDGTQLKKTLGINENY